MTSSKTTTRKGWFNYYSELYQQTGSQRALQMAVWYLGKHLELGN